MYICLTLQEYGAKDVQETSGSLSEFVKRYLRLLTYDADDALCISDALYAKIAVNWYIYNVHVSVVVHVHVGVFLYIAIPHKQKYPTECNWTRSNSVLHFLLLNTTIELSMKLRQGNKYWIIKFYTPLIVKNVNISLD